MFLAAAYLHCARESPNALADLGQAIETIAYHKNGSVTPRKVLLHWIVDASALIQPEISLRVLLP
jgi:hypothetical protein